MTDKMPALRPYQWQPFRAIIESVERNLGHTIVIIMSRQAGKNELSARLEAYLLMTHITTNAGSIVKAAPTFSPQIVTSMQRIQDRLRDFGLSALSHKEMGYMIRLGKSRVIFLSAAPDASIVGATASLLLEIDEAQDINIDKFDKELRPMAASTNATTVLYGTPWSEDDLLHREKLYAIELEQVDGKRRLFEANWQTVAAANPLYGQYVQTELGRMGAEHPLFKTQYALELAFTGGGFLTETQLLQLRGTHSRSIPKPDEVYVMGLDLAGEADDQASPSQRQDRSALVIARVDYNRGRAPMIEVVDAMTWHGVPHLQLAEQVTDLALRIWSARKFAVDATGLGHTLAHILADRIGSRVERFVFTGPSKSQLGFDLLSAISSGGLRIWQDPPGEKSRNTAPTGGADDISIEFWHQLKKAKGKLTPGRIMQWSVPEADGHDDLLMALALCVHAANLAKPRIAIGYPGGT